VKPVFLEKNMLNLKKLGNLIPKRSLNSRTAFLTGVNKVYDENDLKKHPVFKKAIHFDLTENPNLKWGYVHFKTSSDKNEALALATTLLGNSFRPATAIPIGTWCSRLTNYEFFTKLERHAPNDTIEIDGITEEFENKKIEDILKAEFEELGLRVSEIFVYKNSDLGRKYDASVGKCHGKFARVSFDTKELAVEAGLRIRGKGTNELVEGKEVSFEVEKDKSFSMPLTGGYFVNSAHKDSGSRIGQLVAKRASSEKTVNPKKFDQMFEVRSDKFRTNRVPRPSLQIK